MDSSRSARCFDATQSKTNSQDSTAIRRLSREEIRVRSKEAHEQAKKNRRQIAKSDTELTVRELRERQRKQWRELQQAHGSLSEPFAAMNMQSPDVCPSSHRDNRRHGQNLQEMYHHDQGLGHMEMETEEDGGSEYSYVQTWDMAGARPKTFAREALPETPDDSSENSDDSSEYLIANVGGDEDIYDTVEPRKVVYNHFEIHIHNSAKPIQIGDNQMQVKSNKKS